MQSATAKFFALLPPASEEECIAFLRTVPAGTPWQELHELASRYRASHPLANPPADE